MKTLKNSFVFLVGVLFFVPLFGMSCGKTPVEKEDLSDANKFRVLGYLYVYSATDLLSNFRKVDLSQITDLNIAFVNPDEAGNFQPHPDYNTILNQAHEKKVRVFISLGGGSPPAHLGALLNEHESREKMVRGIGDLLETYDFDGVDIDLENELIANQHYPDFVYAVAKAVKPKGRLVTAALASWNSNLIPDSTLAQYDFINVMSYDATGPWNPARSGPHSPHSMAVNDFKYYTETRKIDPEKIFVGLPFYGYGFEGAPESMSYSAIVNAYPGSEFSDEVRVGNGTIYYNGIETIKNKTRFALENGAGGVMIWQLLGDTNDGKSLLKAINETVNNKTLQK